MKNNTYTTVMSAVKRNQHNSNASFYWLIGIFIVLCTMYLTTSIMSLYSGDLWSGEIKGAVVDILSLATSVLISLIAVMISESYGDDVEKKFNSIVEANKSLGYEKIKKKRSAFILRYAIRFILVLVFIFFICVSIMQLCVLYISSLHILSGYIAKLTFYLDIALLILNVLSIYDCIVSSKSYKETAELISDINKKIFDKYNRQLVDSRKS